MKLNNFHRHYALALQKVSNYMRDVAVSVATLWAISTNNDSFITRQKVHHSPQPTALPHLVYLNYQAVFLTVVIWAWTRNILKVLDFQGNQIATLIARIYWVVSTQVGTVPSRFAKPLFLRKSIAKLGFQRTLAIIDFPAIITATTNLQDKAKNKLKNSRNLRSWEIFVCRC